MNITKSSLKKDYPLPPQNLRFMGENNIQFMEIGDLSVQMLQQANPLQSIHSILDIGCGYGRLAHALLRCGEFKGTYYGLDILPNHITWCQHSLSPLGPYHFKHLDVFNARYNPSGKHHARDLDFSGMPTIDIISFFSVFTHMYEDDIKAYLKLSASILCRNGKLICTAFLHNEQSNSCEAEGKSRYPMPHFFNEYTRYYNDKDPLHAIGYEENSFAKIINECGFEIKKTIYGGWCGRKVKEKIDPFQDLIIMQLKKINQIY